MATGQQSGRAAGSPGDEHDDYYRLLNVPYTATFQEITQAYRVAMKRAHPDRHHPERRAAAEERAKLLNRAYTTLSKSESRRAYDASIRAGVVQDQIMGRYVGGFAPGGASDPFGQALRRERTHAERREQRQSDRSAIASVLIVFGGATAIVIGLLLAWSLLALLVGWLS